MASTKTNRTTVSSVHPWYLLMSSNARWTLLRHGSLEMRQLVTFQHIGAPPREACPSLPAEKATRCCPMSHRMDALVQYDVDDGECHEKHVGKVTLANVRLEQLHAVTDETAARAGFCFPPGGDPIGSRDHFERAWREDQPGTWDANPWVWVGRYKHTIEPRRAGNMNMAMLALATIAGPEASSTLASALPRPKLR